jgi:hypothetical protein
VKKERRHGPIHGESATRSNQSSSVNGMQARQQDVALQGITAMGQVRPVGANAELLSVVAASGM